MSENFKIQNVYRLTPIQEGMVYHTLLHPDSSLYFCQISYNLEGHLDVGLLERSMNELFSRHEMLRVSIVHKGFDHLLQVVLKERAPGFVFKDLRHLTNQEKNSWIEQYKESDEKRSFDLTADVLMRVALLQTGETTFEFIWTYHHVIMDGWCFSVLITELYSIYNSLLFGNSVMLPPAPQYGNYVMWMDKQNKEEGLRYWEKYLRDYHVASAFPSLGDREKDPSNVDVVKHKMVITGSDFDQLTVMAKFQTATLSTVVQVLWGFLLSKYSDRKDVVFGSVVSGRPAEVRDVDSIVGVFINTIPVRVNFEGKQTLKEVIKEISDHARSSEPYHYVSLADIQANNKLKNRLFDHYLVFENYPLPEKIESSETHDGVRSTLNLTINHVDIRENTGYPLYLTIAAVEGALNFSLYVDHDRYGSAFGPLLLGQLQHLFRMVITDDEVKISDLELVSMEDKIKWLQRVNPATTFYAPKAGTLVELFEQQCKDTPNNVAVSFEDLALSYKQVNERANTIARYLRETCGVKVGHRIALMVSHSEKLIVGLLAIMKAGGTFLPIDPSYPADRKKFILLDASVDVVITEIGQANEIDAFTGNVIFIDLDDSFLQMSNRPVERSLAGPDDVAYIIYTSGSTGLPKGVAISHRSLLNYIHWCNSYYYGGDDRHLVSALFTSLSFDLTLTMIFTTLLRGKKVCVFDSTKVNDALTQIFNPHTDIDTIKLTPSHIAILDDLQVKTSNVSSIIVGGEKLTHRHVGTLRRLNPSVKIYNEYGPTEATVGCIVKEVDTESKITIGNPIANTRIYIIDPQFRIQPVGVVGEICIAGDGLAVEYVNRRKLTSERFVWMEIPGCPAERIYRTGDYGRWLTNGEVEYIGRRDDQVKLRSYRIELGEIENVILGYSGVQQVVAKVTTGTDSQLVAFCVCNKLIDLQALRHSLKTSLPVYMIPSRIVLMEEFPTTVNGKVDRSKLVVPDLKSGNTESILPANELEFKLQQIWQSVLDQSVGVEDDFFEAGGHSLKMIRIISRMYKELKINVPLSIFFETLTVRSMASWIASQEAVKYDPIVPIKEEAVYRVSFGQRRLWLLAQNLELGLAYNLSNVFLLEGDFNKNAFESAWSVVIKRHEILRTVFVVKEGDPWQRILPVDESKMDIVYSDLADDGGADVISLAEEEQRKLFDLEHGPLLRIKLVQLSANAHGCILTIPHIISDGWSMNLLMREVSQMYNNALDSDGAELTPLHIQYKDYAAWQARQLAGTSFESGKRYWMNQLSGDLPAVKLPADYSRPINKNYERKVLRSTSAELNSLLNKISQKQGVSVFMVVVAAVKTLLYRYTGLEDITIAAPSAGRNHPDLEGQLGLFVNTLPLRTRFDGAQSFVELLKHVKETVTNAFDHETYPFDLLVEDLQHTRDMARSPLFDVAVTTHNDSVKKSIQWKKLEVTSIEREVVTSEYDLIVDVGQEDLLATLTVAYNSALYHERRISRMLTHFHALLVAVVSDCSRSLNALNILGENEEKELLHLSKGSQVPATESSLITTWFEQVVYKQPASIAVSFSGVTWTYRALNEQSNRIAHFLLHQLHIKKDDVIGIIHERSDRLVILAVAVLKAGAAYMPMDPGYPKERIQLQLQESSVKALLRGDDVTAIHQNDKHFNSYTFSELMELSKQYSAENISLERSPDDLAYVVFTSGSTGKPKGVMIEHKSLANLCRWHQREFDVIPSSKATLYAQVGFDACVWEMWPYLLAGAALYPIAKQERLDPVSLTTLYKCERITHSFVPTVVCEQLISEPPVEGVCLLTGGDRLKISDQNGWKVINNYGPSEATVVATSIDLQHYSHPVVPIGRPIINSEIYVLNEALQLQPIGVSGELYVGGAGVARGYVNDPIQTKERFIRHPADPSRKLYRTGDFAHWLDDGMLAFDGRKDNQIKLFGLRIELEEIEAQIIDCPGVVACVVRLFETANESKELVAYYIAKHAIPVSELRLFLMNRLPYYMVPNAWTRLDAFPVSENGKLDYSKLPLPETNMEKARAAVASARDLIETDLVNIWEEVLRKKPIGIRDNFFQLGGNSLTVINVFKKIDKKYPGTIKISSLYSLGTIEELGLEIRSVIGDPVATGPEVQDFAL